VALNAIEVLQKCLTNPLPSGNGAWEISRPEIGLLDALSDWFARRGESGTAAELRKCADSLRRLFPTTPPHSGHIQGLPAPDPSAVVYELDSRLSVLRKQLEVSTVAGTQGPVTEGIFMWAGKSYEFPALQWRLLRELFGAGSVAVEVVLGELYPCETDPNDAKLRKLTHDTNNKLLKHGLPFSVEHPAQGFITLQQVR
jgi:hypothetical protein